MRIYGDQENSIFEEREGWKSLRSGDKAKFAIVSAEEVEDMHFHKEPDIARSILPASVIADRNGKWTVINRRYVEGLHISGISQQCMLGDFNPCPVPRDPKKALIGHAMGLPKNNLAGDFVYFEPISMLYPEINARKRYRSYAVHAHCWLLLDRVIGHSLVVANSTVFVNAIKEFWKSNSDHWGVDSYSNGYVDGYDDPFYPLQSRLREPSQTPDSDSKQDSVLAEDEDEDEDEDDAEGDSPTQVDTNQNPLNVPEIRALITQAVRGHPGNEAWLEQGQQSITSNVPLEISMMVVNALYRDIYHNQASVDDIRNMLTAFRWRLPDAYWQVRCHKDLIFEFNDLIQSKNQTVDWQFLCLETEKLFSRDGWYDNGGLKNRGRILTLLQSLRETFFDKLKQGESQVLCP